MTTLTPYWFAAGALFAIGLASYVCARHVVRRLLAVNLMVNGIFVFMVTLAARTTAPDPLLHALVLTGLVISVSATAMGLVFMRRLRQEHGDTTLEVPR